MLPVASEIHCVRDVSDLAERREDKRYEDQDGVLEPLADARLLGELDASHHHAVADVDEIARDVRDGPVGKRHYGADLVRQAQLVETGREL